MISQPLSGLYPMPGSISNVGPIIAALLTAEETETRMLKAECEAEGCGFIVRVAAKQVKEVGPPHCPKHGAMTVDLPEDEGTNTKTRNLGRPFKRADFSANCLIKLNFAGQTCNAMLT